MADSKNRKHNVTVHKASKAKSTPDKIDLHGLTVEEALERVEEAVNQAILFEMGQLQIVHGIGTGRVKKAVHAYLSESPVVEQFKVDTLNPGVTWVYF